MTKYQVILDDARRFRFQAMLVLVHFADYTRVAAKAKVDAAPCVVYEGDKWVAQKISDELRAAGVASTLRAMPLEHIPQDWAAGISDDRVHCRQCGAALFYAVPGVTSENELIDFATHSAIANKATVLKDKWIHPGVYCPQGCAYVLAHLGSD